MAEIDTGIVDKAVRFAAEKHSGSTRKGTDVPYIVHPMEAAAIVAGITDDQELIAAALLHDTLEDTGATYDELVSLFGKRVADLVAAESEDKQEEKPAAETWKVRKQTTIDELKKAGYDSRLLVLADKLSNIRAIERDVKAQGDCFWNRFNQKDPLMHAWYYMSIAEILESDPKLKDTQACREYADRVKAVFGYYPKADENKD